MNRPLDYKTRDEILDSFEDKLNVDSTDVWEFAAATTPGKLKDCIEIDDNEKKEIRKIEMEAIGDFIAVCMRLLNLENPISLIDSKTRIILEEEIEDEVLDELSEKSMKTTMTIRYVMTNGTFTTYKVKGKIPSKGFFSTRKSDTNTWYKDYIERQVLGISHVLRKSYLNKSLALNYVIWSTVLYLEIAYPNKFKQSQQSLNEHVYDIIVKLIPRINKDDINII